MKKIIDFVASLTLAVSVLISLFIVVPGGDQGYGYDDNFDYNISHEIFEQGHLTVTQKILSPALIMYLAVDKKWSKSGETGGWLITVVGYLMIMGVSLIALALYQEKENWKAILAFGLLVGYILTTLIYLLVNQIVDNGYSW